jgi:putative transcriptional regulator
VKRTEKKLLDTLAKKVKELRTKKGITQVQLAAELDVDIRTVKRIEAGEYNPSLTKLLNIAEVFAVDIKELL